MILSHRITLCPTDIEFFLAILRVRIHKPRIASLIAVDVLICEDERRCLHDLAADLLECTRTEMCHADNFFLQEFCTQLLIARQEHPCVLCHECMIAVRTSEVSASLNKCRKEIALAVRIMFLDKLRKLRPHAFAAHIGRVCDDDMIFLKQ